MSVTLALLYDNGKIVVRYFANRAACLELYANVYRSRNVTQSCPWVGLTRGLGWVGSGWVEIFQFLVGWVYYSKSGLC